MSHTIIFQYKDEMGLILLLNCLTIPTGNTYLLQPLHIGDVIGKMNHSNTVRAVFGW